MNALFPLLITFGLMWVLLIRPQQRRVRQHQAVVATLVEGDEVVTTGGLIGTIEDINDDVLTVEVAPGVSVRMLRSAVQTRIGGSDEAGPDEAGPDEAGPDEAGPDETDFGYVESEETNEEPELPAIETAAVDELAPGVRGGLPPVDVDATAIPSPPAIPAPPAIPTGTAPGGTGTGSDAATAARDDATTASDAGPPRRPDAGNGA